jgi:UPF0716 protein FxsA
MLPLLAALFVVVPIAELAVLITVGRVIGAGWTILLVIFVSVVGAWLARREGMIAWRRFQGALIEGRVPTTEVADGAMILMAGALMVTPGFISDVVAIGLLIPPIRALARRSLVQALVKRSLRQAGIGGGGGLGGFGGAARPWGGPGTIDGNARVSRPGPSTDGRPDSGASDPSSTKVTWGKPEPDPDDPLDGRDHPQGR